MEDKKLEFILERKELVDFSLKIVTENKGTNQICLENNLNKDIFAVIKTCNSIEDKIANKNHSMKVFIISFIGLGLLTILQIYCSIQAFELEVNLVGNVTRCTIIVGTIITLLILWIFRKRIFVFKMNKLNKKCKHEYFKYSVIFTQDEIIVVLANEIEIYKLDNVINFVDIGKKQNIRCLYIKINENKIKKVIIPRLIGETESVRNDTLEHISKLIEKNKDEILVKKIISSKNKYNKRMIIAIFVSIFILGKVISGSVNFISIYMPTTYNKIEIIRENKINQVIKQAELSFNNVVN